MNEFESRVAAAVEREFGVRFDKCVQFGQWGSSDMAAKLDRDTLLVVEVGTTSHPACISTLALWAYLDGSPSIRSIILRVTKAGDDLGSDPQAALASFLDSKLCEEVPEQFVCYGMTLDDAGVLSGEVDEARALIDSIRAAHNPT